MKKRLLMLGAGFMQGVAIRAAKEKGWEVFAVDGNSNAVYRSLADHFEPIDLKDREALAVFALKIKGEGGLDAVFTAATDFSASVAWVAQACGLPGHGYEQAMNASDKLRMRACFKRDGVPSPTFIGINQESRSRILTLMEDAQIRFPIVIKPVDNMGARGCRKVVAAEELEGAIDDAIKYSRSGYAIVEEFMDGPEFSVEALVFNGEIHMTGIADRHIFFPPYFIEMGHTIPSGFSDSEIASLVDVFKKGVVSLGLSHGVAKGDIKLTKTGPMVGEIAGRLSGGYMSGWTFPYSSGINLTAAALDLAAGIIPSSLIPERNWTSAERAWISIPGTVASVSGYEKARTIPYIRDVFSRSSPGDTVVFPVNNVEKCGNCLASAPTRALAIQAAEDACRVICVRLTPSNPATDEFLATNSSFPPDAFMLPEKIDANFDVLEPHILSSHATRQSQGIIQTPSFLVPFLDTILDWQGRTIRQSLDFACEMVPGLAQELGVLDSNTTHRYYKALIRGGIQGIVYIYDSVQR